MWCLEELGQDLFGLVLSKGCGIFAEGVTTAYKLAQCSKTCNTFVAAWSRPIASRLHNCLLHEENYVLLRTFDLNKSLRFLGRESHATRKRIKVNVNFFLQNGGLAVINKEVDAPLRFEGHRWHAEHDRWQVKILAGLEKLFVYKEHSTHVGDPHWSPLYKSNNLHVRFQYIDKHNFSAGVPLLFETLLDGIADGRPVRHVLAFRKILHKWDPEAVDPPRFSKVRMTDSEIRNLADENGEVTVEIFIMQW